MLKHDLKPKTRSSKHEVIFKQEYLNQEKSGIKQQFHNGVCALAHIWQAATLVHQILQPTGYCHTYCSTQLLQLHICLNCQFTGRKDKSKTKFLQHHVQCSSRSTVCLLTSFGGGGVDGPSRNYCSLKNCTC